MKPTKKEVLELADFDIDLVVEATLSNLEWDIDRYFMYKGLDKSTFKVYDYKELIEEATSLVLEHLLDEVRSRLVPSISSPSPRTRTSSLEPPASSTSSTSSSSIQATIGPNTEISSLKQAHFSEKQLSDNRAVDKIVKG